MEETEESAFEGDGLRGRNDKREDCFQVVKGFNFKSKPKHNGYYWTRSAHIWDK